MRTRARGYAAAVVLGTVAACTALELGSQRQQVVSLDMTSYDFGPVSLGTPATAGPFTVSPSGTTDNDYIQSIKFDTMCPDFALQPDPSGSGSGTTGGYLIGSADGNLYAVNGGPHVYWDCSGGSGSCFPVTYGFDASFTPSTTTSQQCVARITTQSSVGVLNKDSTLTLSGSGQGSSYSISADKLTLDFGSVPVNNTSTPQMVTVTNTGMSSLTISGFYNDSVYAVTPDVTAPVTLTPGMGQTYTVTCTPIDTASHPDMLIFTGDGSASATVTLACTGTSINLDLMPNPVSFGAHLVGAAATTRIVTITNPAGAPSVMLSGFGFVNQPPRISFMPVPAPVTLPAGSDTTVTIKYDPSAPDTSGSLGSFVFNANGSQLSVPMTGTTQVGSLGANPAAIDFGPVCAGGAGSAMDVQVATNAAGAVKVMTLEPPTAPFTATATGLPTTLDGGGVGSIKVHAAVVPAADATPGPTSSAIKLDTNIPGTAATYTIPVSATVLAGGIGATPSSLSFGAVKIGTLSEGKQVVLTNCGTAPLTITDARITPATATDYSIEAPANAGSLNKTLQIGESQMFAVQFSPTKAGDQPAKLVLDTDAGIQEIPLDASGYGGSAAGGKERETYYACSTGGPVGMLPIGIACVGLALARRRRRR